MTSVVKCLVEISTLAKAIVESEKNTNSLPELIHYLQREEDEVLRAAITALGKVFSHIIQQDSLWFLPSSKFTDCCHGDVVCEYRCWMRDVHKTFQEQLLCLLMHPCHKVSVLALETLIKMVEWEGRAYQSHLTMYSFPNALFHTILSHLLNNASEGDVLIKQCGSALIYHDVLFHWLRNIASVINSKLDAKNDSSIPDYFVRNVHTALAIVVMPTSDQQLDNFLAGIPKSVPTTSTKKSKVAAKAESVKVLQKYRKQFSDAWLAFLRLPLSSHQLRQVLAELHSTVMPHLLDPRLLLDFLSSAYGYGGVVSLLALNGLYILMNNYHLDYPAFYPQLYQLLDPSIFHVKYTARFFTNLNTFLTSTHLPLYLVAAFIKKIARLSLSAPPDGATMAVVLVTNLTKRHPNCRVLLHRTNAEDYSITSDPFDPDTADLAESHALESCLWELKSLQTHYSPSVSGLVQRLTEPAFLINLMETNMKDHLQSLDTYKAIEFDSKDDEVAVNYKEPMSLWQQTATHGV